MRMFFVAHLALLTAVAQAQHVRTADALTQWISAWASSGGSSVTLHLSNVTLGETPLWSGGLPVQQGILVLAGDGAWRTWLDTSYRVGLLPALSATGTAHIQLQDLALVNLCIEYLKLPPPLIHWRSALRLMILNYLSGSQVQLAQSQTYVHLVQYVRPAEVSNQLYWAVLDRLASYDNTIKASREAFQLPPFKLTIARTTAHLLQTASATAPGSGYINNTVRSIEDPTDPFVQDMRAQGVLKPHRWCNGSLFGENEPEGADIGYAPLWLADTTAGLQLAFARLANYTQTGMFLVGVVHVAASATLTLPLQTQPASDTGNSSSIGGQGSTSLAKGIPFQLSNFTVVVGPFNDVPEYAVHAVLDLNNLTAAIQLLNGWYIFISQLILDSLAPGPLPNATDITSALPLWAFARGVTSVADGGAGSSNAASDTFPVPLGDSNLDNSSVAGTLDSSASTGNAPAPVDISSPVRVILQNVTVMLPPDDFQLLLLLSASELGCVWATDISHPLLLGISVFELAEPHAVSMDHIYLTSYAGWGVQGTNVIFRPAAPLQVTLLEAKTWFYRCMKQTAAEGGGSRVPPAAIAVPVAVGGALLLTLAAGILYYWAYGAKAGRCTRDLPASKLSGYDSECPHPTSRASSSRGAAEDPVRAVRALASQMQEGDTADEKLVLMKVLDKGAQGTVFAGTWRGLPVAVKTLMVADTGPTMQRAVNEAAMCVSLNHRNIASTYHFEFKPYKAADDAAGGLLITYRTLTRDTPSPNANSVESQQQTSSVHNPQEYKLFIVQELCDYDLSVLLHRQLIGNVPAALVKGGTQAAHTELELVLAMLLDIAQGLEYLHSKGVIHGDLKPANVLLKIDAQSMPGAVGKLTDFGFSHFLDPKRTHVSNYRCGTPFYVAPEVVECYTASPASDIFSFGVLMWELYNGEQPYVQQPRTQPTDSEFAWNPHFGLWLHGCTPIAYQHLTARCLARKPKLRPNISQVLSELRLMAVQSLGWPQGPAVTAVTGYTAVTGGQAVTGGGPSIGGPGVGAEFGLEAIPGNTSDSVPSSADFQAAPTAGASTQAPGMQATPSPGRAPTASAGPELVPEATAGPGAPLGLGGVVSSGGAMGAAAASGPGLAVAGGAVGAAAAAAQHLPGGEARAAPGVAVAAVAGALAVAGAAASDSVGPRGMHPAARSLSQRLMRSEVQSLSSLVGLMDLGSGAKGGASNLSSLRSCE